MFLPSFLSKVRITVGILFNACIESLAAKKKLMNRIVLTHPIIDPKQTTHNTCRDINGLISLVLKDIIVLSSNPSSVSFSGKGRKSNKRNNKYNDFYSNGVQLFFRIVIVSRFSGKCVSLKKSIHFYEYWNWFLSKKWAPLKVFYEQGFWEINFKPYWAGPTISKGCYQNALHVSWKLTLNKCVVG